MKPQTWKISLLTGIALVLLASTACQPTETDKYARQSNLPEQDRAVVKRLEWGPDTKELIDELAALPKSCQMNEVVLDYLKDVAADKTITDEELQAIKTTEEVYRSDISDAAKMNNVTYMLRSPENRNAYSSLKAYSDEAMKGVLGLGLDGDVSVWIVLNSTLPKDFADYTVKSKLCIQDKRLSDLEEQFLKEPDKYLQQIYDYYMSEIGKMDQELAIKLKQIPFLKDGIELKDIEALEDILYLASNPENMPKLEKIYGKGIERKMWPVALERIFYKGFENEFDINGSFEGSEWYVNSNLADFQAKYNTEMDQDSVPGPKPAIRGINLLHEPLGNPMIDYNENIKTDNDLKFDYALIKWVLRCNAVRLYCNDDYNVFPHVNLAQSEGLDTWLLFFPLFAHPYIDKDTYRNQLADIATKANDKKIGGLYIGAEFDAWWRIWGGDNGVVTKYNVYNDQLKQYIDDLIAITRQNYKGQITYQEWDPWYIFDKNVNWNNLDLVSASSYIGSYNKQFLDDQLYLSTFQSIKRKYGKPLIIAEVGSLTISESEEAGGVSYYMTEHPYHYNRGKQAQVIDRHLRLLFKAPVDGIFFFVWDEPVNHPWGDMNKYGFGIWEYGHKEPKSGFWTVYRYYKE